MNIQKSKTVIVPETKFSFTVRIDLIKSKVSVKEPRIHWQDCNGVIHIADQKNTVIGEGRYIVTIADKNGNPPAYLEYAASPYLVTNSRVQACACYNAWVNWAVYFALTENDITETKRKLLPSHAKFWNL